MGEDVGLYFGLLIRNDEKNSTFGYLFYYKFLRVCTKPITKNYGSTMKELIIKK